MPGALQHVIPSAVLSAALGGPCELCGALWEAICGPGGPCAALGGSLWGPIGTAGRSGLYFWVVFSHRADILRATLSVNWKFRGLAQLRAAGPGHVQLHVQAVSLSLIHNASSRS